MECCRLRVKGIDFSRNQIVVRCGKGDKDRYTMLPAAVKEPFLRHLQAVKRQHEEDLKKGRGRVNESLDWKLPDLVLAGREKTGWKGVKGEDTWRLIYAKPGVTPETWTEKVEVTQVPIAVTWLSRVRWNPTSLMNAEKASVQKAGCSTDGWTVLQQDDASLLYEWPGIRCPGRLSQHKIVRILVGRWYSWLISYGIRNKTLSPEERRQMIDHLLQAKVTRD